MIIQKKVLQEYLAPSVSQSIVESEETAEGKKLVMKGIFIQGDVKNANQRIYPIHEISRAVDTMKKTIKEHGGVCGEVDHPDDLKINLDRVSHMITDMWMDGANGYGKLKLLPTPMGELIKTMLTSGVKLGVSSRGSGEVDDRTGKVSDFEIVTVDIVAQPSAPNAYPQAVYENKIYAGMLNMNYGHKLHDMLKESTDPKADPRIQKYLREEVTRLIKQLKLK